VECLARQRMASCVVISKAAAGESVIAASIGGYEAVDEAHPG
jgi:hypothetical protein